MNQEARDNQGRDIEASEHGELDALSERLMEEINILRLEGALFCFDPREARRRSGSLTIELPHSDLGKQPFIGFICEEDYTEGELRERARYVANPHLFADKDEARAAFLTCPVRPERGRRSGT